MSQEHHEYLIVGAGPGGLQLGYFFAKNHFDYVILEASAAAGSFFQKFPRHRRLISINKVHTGRKDPAVQFRWDWNSLLSDELLPFKNHSQAYFPPADAMVAYLNAFAGKQELNVHYHHRVTEISRRCGRFVIRTESRLLTADNVVVATGLAEPHIPKIKGIEHAKNYADFEPDPKRFTDRKVLIIGKGNSGFETAESLIPYAAQIHIVSRHTVRYAWHSHHVGDLRAVNNNLIDTDQLKCQNATIWGEVLSIEPLQGRHRVRISHTDSGGRVFTHIYDDIICCTGFRMSKDLFHESCNPDVVLDSRFPKLTEEWESTNVQGLFFVGTLTQSRDFKKSSSAFIHGFRYNARALCNMLMVRNGGRWPGKSIAKVPDVLANAITERMNTASSLWHQFNFLADVVDLSGLGAVYYWDVPTDYALASPCFAFERFLLVTFTHDRPSDPERGALFSREPALHPLIRLIERGTVTLEHHMHEDLEAEWFEESLYIHPLEVYLRTCCERSLGTLGDSRLCDQIVEKCP
jgi:thioredoxin reductase